MLMLLMPVGGALLLLAGLEALWRALAGVAPVHGHANEPAADVKTP